MEVADFKYSLKNITIPNQHEFQFVLSVNQMRWNDDFSTDVENNEPIAEKYDLKTKRWTPK